MKCIPLLSCIYDEQLIRQTRRITGVSYGNHLLCICYIIYIFCCSCIPPPPPTHTHTHTHSNRKLSSYIQIRLKEDIIIMVSLTIKYNKYKSIFIDIF